MTVSIDWKRVSRWCALGAIAMTVWLLLPAARCSWGAFRAIPVGQVDDNAAPASADKSRVEQGTGFWGKLSHATSACYDASPPLDQKSWKVDAWLGLIAMTVIARLLAWNYARTRPYS